MATNQEVQDKILDAIEQALESESYMGDEVLKLAEAYAWIRYPSQSHGGGSKQSS